MFEMKISMFDVENYTFEKKKNLQKPKNQVKQNYN